MKFGITGHQHRPNINWDWVHGEIVREISRAETPICGVSSLAKGADQVFAQAILDEGGELISIIPVEDYERYFDAEALVTYRSLLGRSKVTKLKSGSSGEQAFLEAGLLVADMCDVLIAVWDGLPSQGKGGTADIVEHVQRSGKCWLHINPLKSTSARHDPS